MEDPKKPNQFSRDMPYSGIFPWTDLSLTGKVCFIPWLPPPTISLKESINREWPW